MCVWGLYSYLQGLAQNLLLALLAAGTLQDVLVHVHQKADEVGRAVRLLQLLHLVQQARVRAQTPVLQNAASTRRDTGTTPLALAKLEDA